MASPPARSAAHRRMMRLVAWPLSLVLPALMGLPAAQAGFFSSRGCGWVSPPSCGGCPPAFCPPACGPIIIYEPPLPCVIPLDAPEASDEVLPSLPELSPRGLGFTDLPTGHATFFGPPLGGRNEPFPALGGGPGGGGSGTGGGGGGGLGGDGPFGPPGGSGASPGIPFFALAGPSFAVGDSSMSLPPALPTLSAVPPTGAASPPEGQVHQQPEPISLVLLGLGAVALAASRGLARVRRGKLAL